MNCRISLSHRLAAVTLLLCATMWPARAQWSDAELNPITETQNTKQTGFQSLALDALGRPHVIWQEARPDFAGWRIFYTTEGEVIEWQPPDEVGDSTRALQSPALAISPATNRPYVVYADSEDVFVSQLIAGEWEEARLTETPGVFDGLPTIAADSLGLIHVAWVTQDTTGAYRIAYAVGDSSAWTVEVLDSSELGEFGTGAAPQIAVSPQGSPHIIYRGGDYLSYRIHHAYTADFGGERIWSFDILISPNAEDLVGSIDVHGEDDLHVAVAGADGFGFPSHTYYLHKPAGGDWLFAELVSGEFGATNPVIEVDEFGTPHVVWMEVSGNFYTGNLYYSHRLGTDDWETELVAGPGYYTPSFEIDPQGFGHLVFYFSNDEGTESDIYYLRSTVPLAGGPALEIEPDTLDFGAVAVGESASRVVTITNTGTTDVTVLNVSEQPAFTTDFADSVTLAPDSSYELLVIFSPDSGISYAAVLQILTSVSPIPEEVVLLGQGAALGAEERGVNTIPTDYYLEQNYPNPFNPTTTIEFGVPTQAHVEIRVHDVLGREVAVLVDQVMEPGRHRVAWECRECASGTYLVVLSGPDFSMFRKATLVR